MSKMNEDNQPSSNNWFSIGEAAKYLRVSKDTLRRWEKEKIIKSYRSPTNRRYYKKEELNLIFNQKPDLEEKPEIAPVTQKDKKENRLSLVIISLLTLYVVLMVFLAWLLLQSSS